MQVPLLGTRLGSSDRAPARNACWTNPAAGVDRTGGADRHEQVEAGDRCGDQVHPAGDRRTRRRPQLTARTAGGRPMVQVPGPLAAGAARDAERRPQLSVHAGTRVDPARSCRSSTFWVITSRSSPTARSSRASAVRRVRLGEARPAARRRNVHDRPLRGVRLQSRRPRPGGLPEPVGHGRSEFCTSARRAPVRTVMFHGPVARDGDDVAGAGSKGAPTRMHGAPPAPGGGIGHRGVDLGSGITGQSPGRWSASSPNPLTTVPPGAVCAARTRTRRERPVPSSGRCCRPRPPGRTRPEIHRHQVGASRQSRCGASRPARRSTSTRRRPRRRRRTPARAGVRRPRPVPQPGVEHPGGRVDQPLAAKVARRARPHRARRGDGNRRSAQTVACPSPAPERAIRHRVVTTAPSGACRRP